MQGRQHQKQEHGATSPDTSIHRRPSGNNSVSHRCHITFAGVERKWARMDLKSAKFKINSFFLKKGKVNDKFHFKVKETLIQTFSGKPEKNL